MSRRTLVLASKLDVSLVLTNQELSHYESLRISNMDIASNSRYHFRCLERSETQLSYTDF